MRLSSNGYYIESYDKCSVCGKLVYEGEEVTNENAEDKSTLYCSDWCIEWEANIEKNKKEESKEKQLVL